MSLWVLLQIFFNIVCLVTIFIIWNKGSRRNTEDPRISRGLQLLQSKISVIEDLSDRTDNQVKQLVHLLEVKTKQLQNKVFESEKQIQRIEQSMQKSLEVADIFQDKIPHEEILERQTSVKYIQAAQLAHQGRSVDDIVKLVGLTRGEVEFIVKVNKDELMFDEKNLPEWAKKQIKNTSVSTDYSIDQLVAQNLDKAFDLPQADLMSLEKLGQEFKAVCREYEQTQRREMEPKIDFGPTIEMAKDWSQKISTQAGNVSMKMAHQAGELSHKMAYQAGDLSHRVANKASLLSQKVAEHAGSYLNEASQKVGDKVKDVIQNKIKVDELFTMPSEKIIEDQLTHMQNFNTFALPGVSSPRAEKKAEQLTQKPLTNEVEVLDAELKDMKVSDILNQAKKSTQKSFSLSNSNKTEKVVKKVIFPRIDGSNNY